MTYTRENLEKWRNMNMALNKETQELLLECVTFRLADATEALKENMQNFELMRKITKLEDLRLSLANKTASE